MPLARPQSAQNQTRSGYHAVLLMTQGGRYHFRTALQARLLVASLIEKLRGGDLRSIGRSDEVVVDVLEAPERLDEVFEGLFHGEAVVRARSADALEKVCARRPEWFRSLVGRLIRDVATIDQKEVRWHVAQILGRVRLTARQRQSAVGILESYLENSDSQIVKVSALQALADLAASEPALRPRVVECAEMAIRSGSKSLKARARKILAEHN